MVHLSQISRGVFLSCFLGYHMDQDFLRKGYMTEAVAAVVDYAFGPLGLHRVEANVMPRNLPPFPFCASWVLRKKAWPGTI